MNYKAFGKEDFDAIVTGELTHYAIWLEHELIGVISDHFAVKERREDFERLILRRDGLTFQGKIEIVRAMLPLFAEQAAALQLRPLLDKIENFKSFRNAFAHGVDVTPQGGSPHALHVQIVGRSGKEKTVIVGPDEHELRMSDADTLLRTLQSVRSQLKCEPQSVIAAI